MKSQILKMLFIASVLFTVSCNSDDPLTAAKAIIKEDIDIKSKGYFKLLNLEKKDGLQEGNSYIMNCDITIEGIKNGGWIILNNNDEIIHGSTVEESLDRFFFFDKRYMKATHVKEGDRYIYNKRIVLIKTDNGWQKVENAGL